MNRHAQQSGFSLLELVIAVGILTVIMAVAFQLMTKSQVSYDANQALVQAHGNADFAVGRVVEMVRGAGSNPGRAPIFNSLAYLENPDATSIRLRSDYDGDGDITSRLSDDISNPKFYLLGSEDVTIRWYEVETTDGGVTVPAYSLAMIDNTPNTGTGTGQGVPVVIASNIRFFSCTPALTNPVRSAILVITAGPSTDMDDSDPRYREFTRETEIRLRSFT